MSLTWMKAIQVNKKVDTSVNDQHLLQQFFSFFHTCYYARERARTATSTCRSPGILSSKYY